MTSPTKPTNPTNPMSREEVASILVEHFPHGYRCGEECDHHMNSPEGWAGHVAALLVDPGGGHVTARAAVCQTPECGHSAGDHFDGSALVECSLCPCEAFIPDAIQPLRDDLLVRLKEPVEAVGENWEAMVLAVGGIQDPTTAPPDQRSESGVAAGAEQQSPESMSDPTPLDHADLRQRAEAAKAEPCRWNEQGRGEWCYTHQQGRDDHTDTVQAFRAAATPVAVLALLDEIAGYRKGDQ